jgi:amino acid adenylation domain-containing protein
MSASSKTAAGIAIVGLAGRFPGAKNVDAFWRNLCQGVEGISFFTDEELAEAGIDFPRSEASYVKARGWMEGADLFDAGFFGINPREAEVMDPQHRVFLECAWEALENAGYDPGKYDGAIGVFAGMSMNTYLAHNLLAHPELIAQLNEHQLMLGNDKDFLPTRVAYKLNLRGPALNIQTACSTSLVAVCIACQNLLAYECDLALAGAVSITFPQKRGYFFQEGGIASPDGHCRAFDARAAGTVAGEGAGIVVLKRLEDAMTDGDTIYAVIKGFALNNDGCNKVGYTAPSVEGQAEVIAAAQAMADFSPDTIGYVETHGTGTPLGDPIEMEGLTRAFRTGTDQKQFCAIGSVKSNVGHLDVAAGVTGLIKTALALHHKQIPPSLHFESPNPKIDFANSPFHVNTKLADWKNGETPRRAGVSSFGIGGTNAHVVLEEAPTAGKASAAAERPGCSADQRSAVSRVGNPQDTPPAGTEPTASLRYGTLPTCATPCLLLLSARTETALDQATANLAGHLKQYPELNLADAAYTLQTGRCDFAHRRMLVCGDANDAIGALATPDPKRVFTGVLKRENPPVVFMFPGQGAQQANMGLGLYQNEPVFCGQVDRCCELLQQQLGLDLRAVLYPEPENVEAAMEQLRQTAITQPALFVIEYALAKLWLSWGVVPEAMIGHSLGEYVAACLAEVFPLEDALKLVAARGQLMQQLPRGAMLAIRLPEAEVRPLLNDQLSLATVNGPALCVVSGPVEDVETLRQGLERRSIAATPLQTSHAFHSAMMEPVLKPFAELVKTIRRLPPRVPFLSNVTGTWITADQATDPGYWAKHLRETVRFADGLGELLKEPGRVFLEVGPGHTLSSLAKQHPSRNPSTLVLATLSPGKSEASDETALLTALGRLWLAGLPVNWRSFYARERRKRVPLPAYPFERKRYFVDPKKTGHAPPVSTGEAGMEEPAEVPVKIIRVPSSAVEEAPAGKGRIAAELREILGGLSGLNFAEISGDTTFMEAGFDSLALTQLSLATEKKLGVRVAFRQLLEKFSTMNTLAAQVELELGRSRGGRILTERSEIRGPESETDKSLLTSAPAIPLTDAQREVWFASQMGDAASCTFNESRLLRLRGTLAVDSMMAALQKLVARHEALRTTFAPAGDVQQIHRELTLKVPTVDWSGLATDEREVRLESLQQEEARQPFDLVHGPLLRARLIGLGKQHHVLMLTVHHLVCDGHAFGIVLCELGELYSAAVHQVPETLPPPLPLGEYAARVAERKQDTGYAAAETFWLDQFAGGAPALELPTDGPRPAAWTFAGARETHRLPAGLGQELKRLGSQQGCTLFTTLLAVYGLWLRRLTGREELVVGIPTADRAMDGGDRLVGHCINFLPLRCRIPDDLDFAGLLQEVKQDFLKAFEHRQFTFGSLIQKLNLPRDQSRMPLVQATFNVEHLAGGLKFSGLECELSANPHSFTGFDLNFNVLETDGTLLLDCRYNTALFSAATIRRWLGHFQTLLESAVARPQRQVARLPMLSADERRQTLEEWNATRIDFPRNQCIHQLFEEQVGRTPDAVAVVFLDQTLTYQELNRQANRLARRLQERGIGPDKIVALSMERSLEMVIAMLAVLKAGGAYLPLDVNWPVERLNYMLENSRAHLGLERDEVVALLAAADGQDDGNPNSDVQPGHLAYVIYTSGSTGKPKGVAIEHRNTVNFIHWARRIFSPEELDGVLFATSICFDLSILESFVPLSCGGRVILVEDVLDLPSLLHPEEVKLINTVPSAMRELLRVGGLPESVRTVNLAGEPLPRTLADQIYEQTRVEKVYDLYGPSETTTYSTFARRQPGGAATIGRPIANTQIYLLDKNLEPVPVGVPGEMYIGGEGVTRGYLHAPELTAERFVPNPFGGESKRVQPYPREFARKGGPENASENPATRTRRPALLYRTGDLARWRPDGTIEFLGRADNQVKIRGFRVELGEIEAVLVQHPVIRECVVAALEDSPGSKRVVAYLVPEPDKAAATVGELRRFLEIKLPAHMVPSVFVFLDALPLTPNGKVDRKALPAPEPARREPGETFVAPATATEETLARIWREVLRVEQVGTQDNFFELGGHSLLMTQVISRVREAFQVELPMRSFFETPTITALAVAIEALIIQQVSRMSEEEAHRLVHSQD